MTEESLLKSTLWKQFQQAAREHRRNPARMLAQYMRECLETWEDEQLDEEIRRDAQKSGYREEDAVEIVRQYRLEKQAQRAAS